MHCDYALRFLRDVLKRCHIQGTLLSPQDPMDATIYSSSLASRVPSSGMTIHQVIGTIADNTQYKFKNELRLRYLFMRLPIASERDLLFIGPYLSAPPVQTEILEIGEMLHLPPNAERFLAEYYDSLPVLTENDRLFSIIDTFCEQIWQTPAFPIAEINRTHTLSASAIGSRFHGSDFDELLADMEKMEKRYALENELIRAVELGQLHKSTMLHTAFDERMFERRAQDPLRNAKNYCIIMNTLLRKAAERGGVHPLYIDRTSSQLAYKIELTTDSKIIPTLMDELFSTYCQLVRKHSTKQYSPIVKKAILMIDADISAELSLGILAKKQGISAGYLATIFRKETGETVSSYIRGRRIDHAIHLLNTTSLQIQTIAMHCGIMDVQYFSKLFKRQVGKTPNEYRKAIRR